MVKSAVRNLSREIIVKKKLCKFEIKKHIKIEASCKDFKLSKTGTLISIKTNMYKAAKIN